MVKMITMIMIKMITIIMTKKMLIMIKMITMLMMITPFFTFVPFEEHIILAIMFFPWGRERDFNIVMEIIEAEGFEVNVHLFAVMKLN